MAYVIDKLTLSLSHNCNSHTHSKTLVGYLPTTFSIFDFKIEISKWAFFHLKTTMSHQQKLWFWPHLPEWYLLKITTRYSDMWVLLHGSWLYPWEEVHKISGKSWIYFCVALYFFIILIKYTITIHLQLKQINT